MLLDSYQLFIPFVSTGDDSFVAAIIIILILLGQEKDVLPGDSVFLVA
jgi:hypothetical protein